MSAKPGIVQASFNFEEKPVAEKENFSTSKTPAIPWIQLAKNAPYFITDAGESWTPIGQNDAITWPDLAGAFRRKNLQAVEGHLHWLVQHGVTCIRVMLEYCQGENRYLEKPVGYFQPNMVQLWDDIFYLCEKIGLRILLTPFDTFWMWRRWEYHPYHIRNKGTCAKRTQWLLCPTTRAAIKNRLAFATERWGRSGALFAWDLWNEIRPSHSGNSTKGFASFVEDVSGFLRTKEMELHGRAHLQTVSVFSPMFQKYPQIAEAIFRHPLLDFATIHLYEQDTIDRPKNTVDAAVATGKLTREILTHISPNTPFFDSEHGPITTFNRFRKTLPEAFDDEYFRHMQWAHLASGGAGGGMRWPYRQPHVLTHGMRRAQLSLYRFLPFINWRHFRRENISNDIELTDAGLVAFGCADTQQAVIWLLRINAIGKNKLVKKEEAATAVEIFIPLLKPGYYNIILWNTLDGKEVNRLKLDYTGQKIFCVALPPVKTDLAIAVKQSSNECR